MSYVSVSSCKLSIMCISRCVSWYDDFFSYHLGYDMMIILMSLWSSWDASLAQCIACVASSFVGGCAMPRTFHLFSNACSFDPKIWSLGCGKIYEFMVVGHVIGDECWIAQTSMR